MSRSAEVSKGWLVILVVLIAIGIGLVALAGCGSSPRQDSTGTTVSTISRLDTGVNQDYYLRSMIHGVDCIADEQGRSLSCNWATAEPLVTTTTTLPVP